MLISFNWYHFSVALSVYVPQGFIILADYVYKAIDALPVTAHPMTQFASGVMALQVCRWIFGHNLLFTFVLYIVLSHSVCVGSLIYM